MFLKGGGLGDKGGAVFVFLCFSMFLISMFFLCFSLFFYVFSMFFYVFLCFFLCFSMFFYVSGPS